MSKYIWTVTRQFEYGFGPTEKEIVGVYSNSELAYAAILRHIIATHRDALEDLEPDGSDPNYHVSRIHDPELSMLWSLDVWNINAGTCEHRGSFR